jgi:hypothetical protein
MKHIIILMFALLMAIPDILCPEIAATFTTFHYPKNIVIEGEQMVVTDYPSIHILSLKDYRLLKTFGREGFGPGEFWIDQVIVDNKERGLLVRIEPDYILVNSFLWISFFSRDGEFIKTIRLKDHRQGSRFWPLGKNFAAAKAVREGKKLYITVTLFDQKLEKIKEIYRAPHWHQGVDAMKNFFERATHSMMFMVYDKKIFVVKGGSQKFAIYVYNQWGNKLYTIEHESEKINIPKEYITQVHDWFKIKFKRGLEWNLKHTIFPEYFPAIHDLRVTDKKIYVLTYKRNGNKNEVIVLDLKGNLLKKAMITVAERNPENFHAFVIHKGKFYQFIEEDEEETWELHVTNIE